MKKYKNFLFSIEDNKCSSNYRRHESSNTLNIIIGFIGLPPTIVISPAYARHPCTEGTEVAFHTKTSSLCLDPFELKSACTPPRGSLAGNPVCSAVSNHSALKENFPLIQDYANSTAQDLYSRGEQEVIEEGQGIPGGEQEVIEEGQ
jgi:hypothetical protein